MHLLEITQKFKAAFAARNKSSASRNQLCFMCQLYKKYAKIKSLQLPSMAVTIKMRTHASYRTENVLQWI